MTDVIVTGGIAVAAIVASVITSAWIGSINAAKFRGTIEATVKSKFESVQEDVARLENADRDLWKKATAISKEVGEVRDRVSTVEGRMNGKAYGAHR